MASQLDIGAPQADAARKRPTTRERGVHLVGSLPSSLAPDLPTGMRWVLAHAGDARLVAVPCDVDPYWITGYVQSRSQHPGFVVVKAGECTSYADIPTHRVRRGHRLTTEDVALGRPREVAAAFAVRRLLEAEFPNLPPVQVSVPSPVDLSLFTFGHPGRALRHYSVFERMIRAEVAEVVHRHGAREVTFQLESPAALYLVHRAPSAVRTAVARAVARQLARVISATCGAVRWTVHLCHGDLGHTALFRPHDFGPAVVLVNALAEQVRALGRPVPAVHIPMAHGDQPPPADPAAYAPLRRLTRGVDVIAGCVDERHPDRSAKALVLSELALGHRVLAVGAACGYGRRTPAEATANVELARDLARS
ncbi:hypothetical protein [Saccharopolyspora thermophila]|uniref:Uncharacterized protein n=1 Tax=Saccharopolyspora thermophila TaxID=89367 RepID=A0ABN1CDS4_9PSEU